MTPGGTCSCIRAIVVGRRISLPSYFRPHASVLLSASHSHMSPDGSEIVFYEEDYILPVLLLTMRATTNVTHLHRPPAERTP